MMWTSLLTPALRAVVLVTIASLAVSSATFAMAKHSCCQRCVERPAEAPLDPDEPAPRSTPRSTPVDCPLHCSASCCAIVALLPAPPTVVRVAAPPVDMQLLDLLPPNALPVDVLMPPPRA